MHSNQEPTNLFGGMAASSWNSSSDGVYVKDQKDKCSWLFKIEMENN